MANTKKVTDEVTEETVETTVETVVEEAPAAAPTAKVAPAAKTVDTSAERIANLEGQLAQMTALVQQLLLNQANVQAAPVENRQKMNTFVKIIHLVQRAPGLSTYIKLSNLDVFLTEFGEERSFEQQQFEEMLGKYRHWFDAGILSVAAGYEDVAERYGLKTAKDYPMDSDFVRNMGVLPMDKIEEVYKKLPVSGKSFIISYWKLKVLQNDMNFKDTRKIETLDRISNGEMENVIIDIKSETKRK